MSSSGAVEFGILHGQPGTHFLEGFCQAPVPLLQLVEHMAICPFLVTVHGKNTVFPRNSKDQAHFSASTLIQVVANSRRKMSQTPTCERAPFLAAARFVRWCIFTMSTDRRWVADTGRTGGCHNVG